jgi:hypothetical protein
MNAFGALVFRPLRRPFRDRDVTFATANRAGAAISSGAESRLGIPPRRGVRKLDGGHISRTSIIPIRRLQRTSPTLVRWREALLESSSVL